MADEKPAGKTRVFWLFVYALLCACEFVIDKVKDFASERITGHPADDDDEDGDDDDGK